MWYDRSFVPDNMKAVHFTTMTQPVGIEKATYCCEIHRCTVTMLCRLAVEFLNGHHFQFGQQTRLLFPITRFITMTIDSFLQDESRLDVKY